MMLEQENGAAMKPVGNHPASAAFGLIGRPIRRAAIDMDRLVGGPLQRFAILISRWQERRAELRSLQRLDDHMLKDIGVSRCDVDREVRTRWFAK